MQTPVTPGRRERKKAATRQSIADAALRLFLERGYDQVSIRDIANAADVSTTTLFKHFTGKEALVFDEQAHMQASLVAAVRGRPEGLSVVEALRDFWLAGRVTQPDGQGELAQFTRLVESTPALRLYAERVWAQHTDILAAALADEFGVPHDNIACASLARFALQVPTIVRGRENPGAAVEEIFAFLADGWRDPR
ncbi:TetR/AcrR family transcriptional regulator [Kineosporia sp. NBRC 101731]|uniref:TetR/AcrR family transcriptional regulator n=1 Tax=Kineosporia sp. NBRC 101731 TaxID=3032199 RepID=UPI00249F98DD|nr:TetR/AcrR family transcriptional regulator [Kineosporia sp. NBRC 101731]GLY29529.1 TetR family transcriptional regulator [Kineosporia sp. NBRC 101731]